MVHVQTLHSVEIFVSLPVTSSSCSCRLTPSEQALSNGLEKVTVAVRSKNLLATAFHPELTEDSRWCAVLSCAICHDLLVQAL